MQAQAKYMKVTWWFTCGGGYHWKFTSANKRSTGGKDMKTIVDSTAEKAL